jgi:hypothetical protein
MHVPALPPRPPNFAQAGTRLASTKPGWHHTTGPTSVCIVQTCAPKENSHNTDSTHLCTQPNKPRVGGGRLAVRRLAALLAALTSVFDAISTLDGCCVCEDTSVLLLLGPSTSRPKEVLEIHLPGSAPLAAQVLKPAPSVPVNSAHVLEAQCAASLRGKSEPQEATAMSSQCDNSTEVIRRNESGVNPEFKLLLAKDGDGAGALRSGKVTEHGNSLHQPLTGTEPHDAANGHGGSCAVGHNAFMHDGARTRQAILSRNVGAVLTRQLIPAMTALPRPLFSGAVKLTVAVRSAAALDGSVFEQRPDFECRVRKGVLTVMHVTYRGTHTGGGGESMLMGLLEREEQQRASFDVLPWAPLDSRHWYVCTVQVKGLHLAVEM